MKKVQCKSSIANIPITSKHSINPSKYVGRIRWVQKIWGTSSNVKSFKFVLFWQQFQFRSECNIFARKGNYIVYHLLSATEIRFSVIFTHEHGYCLRWFSLTVAPITLYLYLCKAFVYIWTNTNERNLALLGSTCQRCETRDEKPYK